MMKYKITAVMILGLSTALAVNHIHFKSNVNGSSTLKVAVKVAEFNKIKGLKERILLEITSPGGSVKYGKKLILALRYSLPVDTYVSTHAASMATDLFMAGENRYIEPDATMLFHGAFFGSYETTQPMLEQLFEYVKTGVIGKQIISDHLKSYADALIKKVGRTVATHAIGSTMDAIKITNTRTVTRIAKTINKPYAWVKKHIFGDFLRDVYITGKQAYNLGIATHLGRPDIKTVYAENRNS